MGKYHDDLSDKENIITVIDACDTVRSYIEGMTKEEFMSDSKTRDACLAQWLVIGERVAKISESLKKRHPEVTWALIVGFKNRSSHSYGTRHFDTSMLWDTVSNDTPAIKDALSTILKEL